MNIETEIECERMAAVEISEKSGGEKEGNNLLGEPTFELLQNGRFKCVETGHELPDHAKEQYSHSKRCRVGLIDYALANNKPPLNMFNQHATNSSKLICKLTGDTINKSEEHIWKHINGKRFFNKLEQMESGKLQDNMKGKGAKQEKDGSKAKENGADKKNKEKKNKEKNKDKGKKEKKKDEIMSEAGDSNKEKNKDKSKKMKKKEEIMSEAKESNKEKNKDKKNKEKKKEEIISEARDSPADSDAEEPEFWMPPVGERWDFDDGGDRWGSDADDDGDDDDDDDDADDDDAAADDDDDARGAKRRGSNSESSDQNDNDDAERGAKRLRQ